MSDNNVTNVNFQRSVIFEYDEIRDLMDTLLEKFKDIDGGETQMTVYRMLVGNVYRTAATMAMMHSSLLHYTGRQVNIDEETVDICEFYKKAVHTYLVATQKVNLEVTF